MLPLRPESWSRQGILIPQVYSYSRLVDSIVIMCGIMIFCCVKKPNLPARYTFSYSNFRLFEVNLYPTVILNNRESTVRILKINSQIRNLLFRNLHIFRLAIRIIFCHEGRSCGSQWYLQSFILKRKKLSVSKLYVAS